MWYGISFISTYHRLKIVFHWQILITRRLSAQSRNQLRKMGQAGSLGGRLPSGHRVLPMANSTVWVNIAESSVSGGNAAQIGYRTEPIEKRDGCIGGNYVRKRVHCFRVNLNSVYEARRS